MNKFIDSKTGLVVTVGIVLSKINERLLPLRATTTDKKSYYSISVTEFLSDRFIETEGAK